MPSTSPARAGTTAVAAVGAAVLMLVLVTWAASIGPDRVLTGGEVERDPVPSSPTTSVSPQETPEDPREDLRDRYAGSAPAWVRLLALAVEIAVLLVVLSLVVRLLLRLREWWRSRQRRHRQPVPEVEFEVLDPVAQVVEAIEDDAAAQRALLEEGEPRNAIVACWRRFELQAARAEIVRRPWQTSSEFVLGVLDQAAADEGAVLRLAALFREARFSDHPVTERHRAEALAALDAIHRTLRARRMVAGPAVRGPR